MSGVGHSRLPQTSGQLKTMSVVLPKVALAACLMSCAQPSPTMMFTATDLLYPRAAALHPALFAG